MLRACNCQSDVMFPRLGCVQTLLQLAGSLCHLRCSPVHGDDCPGTLLKIWSTIVDTLAGPTVHYCHGCSTATMPSLVWTACSCLASDVAKHSTVCVYAVAAAQLSHGDTATSPGISKRGSASLTSMYGTVGGVRCTNLAVVRLQLL